MNDDLKAYADGELPPDAVARLRAALDADPALRREEETIRSLSVALRSLPAPDPVGRAATLAALQARRPLWRAWAPALAGCAAVLLIAAALARREASPPIVSIDHRQEVVSVPTDATVPVVRRAAFERYVRSLGGEVRRDGDGLRAFYPQAAHEDVKRRFLLPDDLPWPTDGLRVRLAR